MVISHRNWKLPCNSMHVAQPASSVRAVMRAYDQDQRRLMKIRETVRLSCYKNKWAARGPQCVLRTLSIVHMRRLFTLILPSIWWTESMLFVLFLC